MLRSQVKESKCFGLDENKKVGTFSKQVEYWMDPIPARNAEAERGEPEYLDEKSQWFEYGKQCLIQECI